MEPTTRPSLVLRLRDTADGAAWAEFAELYEPLIYRLARGKGLQDADARDLAQEVLTAVAAAVSRWDPDPAKGRFRAWLFRIARNLLVNFLAAQRRRPQASGSTSVQELLESQPAADADAAAEFDAEFRRRAFHWASSRVRAEVSDSTWLAFWRTGVDNRPVAEVAEELGLSAGAVYVARSRVLARLRERVLGLTDDCCAFGLGGGTDGDASGTM
jgi:RNA polymerase sigma factor (sigma-70 family)